MWRGFRAPPPFGLVDDVGRWAERNRGGHESGPMTGLGFIPGLKGRAVLAASKCVLLTSVLVFPAYKVFSRKKLTHPKEPLAIPGGR